MAANAGYYSYNAGLGLFVPDTTNEDAYLALGYNNYPYVWGSNGYVTVAASNVANPTARLTVQGGIATDTTIALNGSVFSDLFFIDTSNTAYTASNVASNVSSNHAALSNAFVADSNAQWPRITFASNTSIFTSNSLSNYLPLAGGTMSGNVALLSFSGLPSLTVGPPGGQIASIGRDANGLGIRSFDKIVLMPGAGFSSTTSNTAGFLGINNASPSNALDVVGSARITGYLTLGSSNSNQNALVFAGTPSDASNAGIWSGIINRLYDPAGGTSVSSDRSELLLIQNNEAAAANGPDRIRHVAATHKFQVYAGTTTPMDNVTFYGDSNFTDALVITSNGRVGVGTNAPAFALDVAGTVNATSYVGLPQRTYSSLTFFSATGNRFYKIATIFSIANASNLGTLVLSGYVGAGGNSAQKTFIEATLSTRGSYSLQSRTMGNGQAAKSICDLVVYQESDSSFSVYVNAKVQFATWEIYAFGSGLGVTLIEPSVVAAASPTGTLFTASFIDAATLSFDSNRLGVGTATPSNALEVIGTIRASSNVVSKAWTVSPQLCIASQAADMAINSNVTYSLNLEPGNPGNGMFTGGLLNGTDGSGLGLTWNSARLLIRGCMMGTTSNAASVSANLRVYSFASSNWSTLTAMTLTDNGTTNGFTTNVSPVFSLGSSSNARNVLGIQYLSTSFAGGTTYRLGSVYVCPVA